MGEILGIHHVTAICGPAQENYDFYAGNLGLRLVKLTVNFDDPNAYHLYYGDRLGSPGSILTFFPYPEGHPGRSGAGQASTIHLIVPEGSIPTWIERFRAAEIDFDRPGSRDGHEILPFRAPDGLQLELVATGSGGGSDISGVSSVTLIERELEPTKSVLEGLLGFRPVCAKHNRFRFQAGAQSVLVVVDDHGPAGRQGHGGIHHIAFRVADETTQMDFRLELVKQGMHVSAVMDREYFKSIYFREPGGVLLELATDGPGFTVDEAADRLGTGLKLPKQFEPFRAQIERSLPELRTAL